ncbi:MAG: pyridoxamine 5'-phosphate oxidase family protein [Alphaproteobacteria bacterium CG_4_10_14_0_2_um_filter_63_37]|nr:MAG: pyridoxamine 5'-phosphate oxidase [Proteobacteria bacterium CG1_02_64_396]PJA24095.1 MAG: pyridoxamine 5'-phosphate oxidase family protein [Alphaproteobacteria bacterium CG_4_10_14_0_2_um_filter_63_37]
MAQFFAVITDKHREFIARQKLYFVATAAPEGRINLSPKGQDTFRVLGPNRVVWLNLTGSGNETAAHLRIAERMTVMFCSFDADPLIVRLFGTARAIHPRDPEWDALIGCFPNSLGARQIIDMQVTQAQSACGFAVPQYEFKGERDLLTDWAKQKGETGVRAYWDTNNRISIDGLQTGIMEGEDS